MRSIVALVLAAATLALAAAPVQAAEIRVLSTRADLVSGGDALLQVEPAGAKVAVDGKDVSSRFAQRTDGRYVGLLEGLPLGDSVVTAAGQTLTITNHPIGGPVFSGPQIQPWACFEGALDKQCNRAPRYEFLYKSTRGGELRAYNPESPPSDVANTTTDQGKTVPFIVRQEIGALARDEYRIAVLFDPKKPWTPQSPQEGFNHKMVVFHGASCDTGYEQADAPDVLNDTALGRGFVTMSHALNNAGHNCNIVTQAESMVMTKERVIERYGPLRYTIGSGCSGGSLVQQQVANAYPGFYQGITPACSFTDAWSSAMQYVNYQLLRAYFENPSKWAPGVVWSADHRSAVEGHPNPANSVTFTEVIPSSGEPTRSCPGVPAAQVYDEKTNPKGVRCTFQDYMVNVFGKRPEDGFAGRPVGNIGLEYGRKALEAGRISPAQFLDINTKVGSWSMDYDPIAERTDADRPALRNVYKSGAVNTGENLDEVGIIDLRGPDPGAFHDVYRTYTMRARLEREHGTAANQILWRGQVALFGDVNFVDQAIVAMDEWLANVEKDPRDLPLAQKILQDKPKTLTERCTDGNGHEIPPAECDAVVQAYSDPQIEAGMPATDDNMRCALKPLRKTDYGAIVFTDPQWEQMKKIFPKGVCDFSKPGEDRVKTAVWQTYQDEDGRVIYGGRPMGAVPRSQSLSGASARLALVGPRRCVSRRRFSLKLRAPRGQKLRRATIYVDGKRQRTVRGARLRVPISLRGVSKRTVRVKVVAITRSGRRIVAQRRYQTCAAKKARAKAKKRTRR